jgi:hypothetical protein
MIYVKLLILDRNQKMTLDKLLLKSICINNYSCTYDLYGPVRNVLMRADTLFGQVGGGWALEIESFLGLVNWHRADRRVPFEGQNTREESKYSLRHTKEKGVVDNLYISLV